MNPKDIEHFKAKLEKERKLLEDELKTVGQSKSAHSQSWDATPGKIEVDNADESEIADKMEELEDNEGILQQLEKQLVEVNSALDRIKKGTYGICEISHKPIEKDRLEANPSARTSIKFMKK